jgi:plastocyanin
MSVKNKLASILFCVSLTAVGQTSQVKMKSISYEPKRTVIQQGDSVVWKNISYTDHSATSDEEKPTFDTGMVEPGKESKSITFDKSGEYKFHCSVHGKTMSGIIVVKASQK